MKQLLICCIVLNMLPLAITAAASSQNVGEADHEVQTQGVFLGLDPTQATFKTVSICQTHRNCLLDGTFPQRVATYDILIQGGGSPATRASMLAAIQTKGEIPSSRRLAYRLQRAFIRQLKTSELHTQAFEQLEPRITVCMTSPEVVNDPLYFFVWSPVNEKPHNGICLILTRRVKLLVQEDKIELIKAYLKKPNVREIVRRKKVKQLKRMMKKDLFSEPGSSGVVFVKELKKFGKETAQ